MALPVPCTAHEELPALARCSACDRGMCGECWTRNLDGRAVCDLCAVALRAPLAPLVPATLVGMALLLAGVLGRRRLGLGWELVALLATVALLSIISAVRQTRKVNARRAARRLEPRRPSDPSVEASAPLPRRSYAATLRRAGRKLAPPVSGKMASLVLGGAMLGPALFLPRLAALPPWLRAEAVLGAWWMIWTAVLSFLLYRGWRVTRDH